jgi:phytanoyl-CoA hydroxylase
LQSFTDAGKDALEHFEEFGAMVLRGLLDPDTAFRPVFDEYSALLDRLAAEWLSDGTLTEYNAQQPFEDRLLNVQRGTHGAYQGHFDITLNPYLTDPPAFRPDSPMHTGPAVFGFLRNPCLLDAVEAVVGPEIYCAPVQHVRIKAPEQFLPGWERTPLTGASFWHQDLAVVNEDADRTNMVSVFVAVSDVTEQNGCLLVIPGSHRRGLVHHCRTRTANGIPDRLLGAVEPQPVPMQAGDVLFLHRMTFHSSLPNRSSTLRWSFDLRYCPVGQPTGRAFFPGFVARSKADPASVLVSHRAWADSWEHARARLGSIPMPRYTRWNPENSGECTECSSHASIEGEGIFLTGPNRVGRS